MARNEQDREKKHESAVERSLDEFIARANTTLPPVTEAQATALREVAGSTKARRAKKEPTRNGKTLVVLGSQKPLAEETEIVSRLPAEMLLAEEPKKGWFSLRLGLAFVAGAAAVLIITRIIAGSPEPVQPVAAPIAPPPTVTVPAPPIVVEPIPVAPAPAPTPVVAVPAVAPTAEPEPTAPTAPTARRRPVRAAARPATAPAPKKPSGLVDPFDQ